MDKDHLRHRAEQLLEKMQQGFAAAEHIELREIVHELNVHQIELELQNDELAASNNMLERLRQQAEKTRNAFALLYDHAPIGLVIINESGLICHCNTKALAMFNLPDRKVFDNPLANFIEPQSRMLWWARFKSFIHNPEGKKIELQLLSGQESGFYVEITGKKLSDWFSSDFLQRENDDSQYCLLTMTDINDRKKSEEKLLLSASVFENSSEAIMITDANNRIVSANPAFTRITGYPFEEVRGRNPSILASGQHDKEFYKNLWQALLTIGHWQGEICNKRKNGECYPEWLSISALKSEDGKFFRFIAIFSDITTERAVQNLINYQATHDQLTGLPNRTLFHDRLQQYLNAAMRNGLLVTLLFIDLDGFKNINDTLGHSVGDELLIGVAQRLGGIFRSADTFARLGGDEFVVILDEMHSTMQAAVIAKKILRELNRPFHTENADLTISASIGIAVYPKDATDCETLVKYADNAMYAAKQAGRNQYHFFKKEMQLASLYKYSLEKDLKTALLQDQIEVFLQPIVDLATWQIVGAEALARWRHSRDGFIPPSEFIAIAEECGMIGQLGYIIANKACAAAESWIEATPAPLYLSINKSVQQFRMDYQCKDLLRAVSSSRFPIERLVIEITESILMLSYKDYTQTLNKMRDQGIKIFLDDFGTGFSSLSYLKKLPVDKVKIDGSFVKDVLIDKHDASLVEAIISMTHKLGLETIAEGIESSGQAAYLLKQGCHYGQGYYFDKPMPPEAFLKLIQRSLAIDR